MSESATKSDLLPTNLVGTTMAGVQMENSASTSRTKTTRSARCRWTTHTILKLTTSAMPAARINTPIAAGAWDNLREIRVYYITVDSQVQEICYTHGVGWQKGAHLGAAVDNSTCLYAQRQTKGPYMRVGFQSSTAPQTITETCYYHQGGWETRVF